MVEGDGGIGEWVGGGGGGRGMGGAGRFCLFVGVAVGWRIQIVKYLDFSFLLLCFERFSIYRMSLVSKSF